MTPYRISIALCCAIFVVGTDFGWAANDGGEKIELGGKIFSNLSETEKALLREYSEHYPRLQHFYQNVTMEAQERLFQHPRSDDGVFPAPQTADLALTRTVDYVYRGREGSYHRLDISQSRVGIIRPDESFLFGWDPVADTHYLIAHGKNHEEYVAYLNSYAFHNAPVAAGEIPLPWLIFQAADAEGRTIEHVQLERDESGEEIVKIAVTTGFEDSQQDLNTYCLYRNRSWAIKEARAQFGKNGEHIRTYRCHYDGEVDGIPRLKEYAFTAIYVDPKIAEERIVRRRVYTITALTPGAPDLSYFDESGFLNDLGGLGAKTGGSNLPVLYVINGVLLVLIGVYFFRKSQRRQ